MIFRVAFYMNVSENGEVVANVEVQKAKDGGGRASGRKEGKGDIIY